MVTLGSALTRGLGVGLLAGIFLFACQGPDEFLRADDDAGLSGFGGSPLGTGGDTGSGGGVVTGTGGIRVDRWSHRHRRQSDRGCHGRGWKSHRRLHRNGRHGHRRPHGHWWQSNRRLHRSCRRQRRRWSHGSSRRKRHRWHHGSRGAKRHRWHHGSCRRQRHRRHHGNCRHERWRRRDRNRRFDGTGPCAGLCDSPTKFTTESYSSGNVGTGTACFETTVTILGGNCSNVTAPRTFSVNGKVETCGQNWPSLPTKIDGGYCFQFTAGSPDFSAFTTF